LYLDHIKGIRISLWYIPTGNVLGHSRPKSTPVAELQLLEAQSLFCRSTVSWPTANKLWHVSWCWRDCGSSVQCHGTATCNNWVDKTRWRASTDWTGKETGWHFVFGFTCKIVLPLFLHAVLLNCRVIYCLLIFVMWC